MSTAENEERELRVVLDSNVYVSAFTHPQGLCFQIWSQAVSQRYQFVASPAIVNEVGSVLRCKFGWDDQRIVAHLEIDAQGSRDRYPGNHRDRSCGR